MGFESLGRILPSHTDRSIVRDQLLTARVIHEAGAMLERLWPDERATFVRITQFSQGELVFLATNGVAAQELRAMAMRLQNAVNRELGSAVVKKMTVKMG